MGRRSAATILVKINRGAFEKCDALRATDRLFGSTLLQHRPSKQQALTYGKDSQFEFVGCVSRLGIRTANIDAKEEVVYGAEAARNKTQETSQMNVQRFAKALEPVSSYFFPLEHASWQSDRYVLHRGSVQSDITGVRFHPDDLSHAGTGRAVESQGDLVELIKAIRHLRGQQIEPALKGAVICGSARVAHRGVANGSRVLFGLRKMDTSIDDESVAVKYSHRQILESLRNCSLTPDPKKPKGQSFDALEDWARSLKLKKRPYPWWLWLLLLILAAVFLARGCRSVLPPDPDRIDPPKELLGLQIETRSVVIVVDRSGSMEPVFPIVATETERLLREMTSSAGENNEYFADVIFFDSAPESLLSGIEKVNLNNSLTLLDGIRANKSTRGGTNLAPAFQLAADEVRLYGKPTTIIILTDGKDPNILAMLNDPNLEQQFGGVDVTVHTTHPRLLVTPQADSAPIDAEESNLSALAERFNGTFGVSKVKGK